MLRTLATLVFAASSATAAPARTGLPPALSTALADGLACRAEGALDTWWAPRGDPPAEDAVRVVLALWPGEHAEARARAIERAFPGVEVEQVVAPAGASGLIQAVVPWADLAGIASSSGVRRVREPWQPSVAERSEGVATLGAGAWHAEGVDGHGVHVAVLDVGFSGHERLIGDELPDRVDTRFRASAGASAHGTAVAEIVHDVAPEADLGLYTFSTEVDFVAAVEDIAADGWDVVNGSIGFDNTWHADGTSPMSRAVDALVEDGTLYVAASGNENDRYRVGPLALEDDGTVSIGGLAPIRIRTGRGIADVSLRWSDPMEASDDDLDLYVYDDEGLPCGAGEDPQDGAGTPWERVVCEAGGAEAIVEIRLAAGGVDGLEGFLYSRNGLPEGTWSGTRNLTLPADADRALAVGAVELPDTATVAWYSSRGPTDDGRRKPELVGPAGVSTVTWGEAAFRGTSAAAPHVAGAAALVLDADGRRMGPGAVTDVLVEGALDIGDPGWDDPSGAGLVHLGEIPWRGCHCGTVRPRVGPLPLLAWLVVLKRRRALVSRMR